MGLTDDAKSLICDGARRHSFDFSSKGHVNLALTQSGAGDSKEAVRSRSDFLNKGYYAPIREKLCGLLLKYKNDGFVIDAGCGEGYYTDKVESALRTRDGKSNVLAFDISRDAVKYAAKRNRNLSLAVATSYDMPLSDCSVDTVFNAFSPLAISEVSRVLKVGGRFVMVYPGREHLFGLKSVIYKTPYKNEPEDVGLDGFKLLSHETLSYTLKLNTEGDIRALFMMTPYAYRTSREDRERVLSLSEVTTEVEFVIDVYEKI